MVVVIAKAEQRDQFKAAMEKIGLECCRGETAPAWKKAGCSMARLANGAFPFGEFTTILSKQFMAGPIR